MLRSSSLRCASCTKIAVLGVAEPPLRIIVGGAAAPPSLPGVWYGPMFLHIVRYYVAGLWYNEEKNLML